MKKKWKKRIIKKRHGRRPDHAPRGQRFFRVRLYGFTDYARWKYAGKNVFSSCTNPKPNLNLHCTPTLLLT